jgi:hypothetical protein
VKQARRGVKRRRLTQIAVKALPKELPLTEGRLHFIRRVSEQREINLLKEDWKVSKWLRGKHVWATIDLSAEGRAFCVKESRPQAEWVERAFSISWNHQILNLSI